MLVFMALFIICTICTILLSFGAWPQHENVAIRVTLASLQRPTLDEWKEGKENATDAKAADAAKAAKMGAVNKVLAMLVNK